MRIHTLVSKYHSENRVLLSYRIYHDHRMVYIVREISKKVTGELQYEK